GRPTGGAVTSAPGAGAGWRESQAAPSLVAPTEPRKIASSRSCVARVPNTTATCLIRPVLRQSSVRRQVIDLSALIRRRSRRNGHSPAPPASTSPDALRLPPSGRPGEPCLPSSAGRLQEDGDPAEVARHRSPVLARFVPCVGRLAA